MLLGSTSELPDRLRALYRETGVRSILCVPVLIEGHLWGALAIADCEQERKWDPFEIDALRIVSSILGDLIRREGGREALRQSEDQLRATFEQAPAGIFIADASGRYLDANSHACRMLGYTREELTRLRISDLAPESFLAEAWEHFEQVKQGTWTTPLETRLRTRSGSAPAVEITAKALSDGRLQAIVTDITERKRTEEALRRHDAILEPSVLRRSSS